MHTVLSSQKKRHQLLKFRFQYLFLFQDAILTGLKANWNNLQIHLSQLFTNRLAQLKVLHYYLLFNQGGFFLAFLQCVPYHIRSLISLNYGYLGLIRNFQKNISFRKIEYGLYKFFLAENVRFIEFYGFILALKLGDSQVFGTLCIFGIGQVQTLSGPRAAARTGQGAELHGQNWLSLCLKIY